MFSFAFIFFLSQQIFSFSFIFVSVINYCRNGCLAEDRKAACYKLRATSCVLQAACYKLCALSCELCASRCELRVACTPVSNPNECDSICRKSRTTLHLYVDKKLKGRKRGKFPEKRKIRRQISHSFPSG